MHKSRICPSLTLVAILVGASMSNVAVAGVNWNVGIYVGAPNYRNPYYVAPAYYTPAPVYYQPAPIYYQPAPIYYQLAPVYYQPPPVYHTVQSTPVTYTERREGSPAGSREAPINSALSAQETWWNYCADAKAYYPYIKLCPAGWLRVAPQPSNDSVSQPALNRVSAP
jgi:hypothetical protein